MCRLRGGAAIEICVRTCALATGDKHRRMQTEGWGVHGTRQCDLAAANDNLGIAHGWAGTEDWVRLAPVVLAVVMHHFRGGILKVHVSTTADGLFF